MTEKNMSPEKTGQKLIITDRKILDLTGVTDVVSFDETGAVLKTDMGTLAVDGEDLHVTKLDLANGSIILAGKINGLFYTENTGAKSRAKRLFR